MKHNGVLCSFIHSDNNMLINTIHNNKHPACVRVCAIPVYLNASTQVDIPALLTDHFGSWLGATGLLRHRDVIPLK